MKANTRDMLRFALRDLGQATRVELSRSTGLSKVRVNQIVEDLVEQGEVKELPQLVASGGRPAMLYALNADFKQRLLLLLSQDKEGIHVKVELLNALGQVLESKQSLYASLQLNSFVSILQAFSNHRFVSVTLCAPEYLRFSGLRQLVQDLFKCDFYVMGMADALASRQDDSLSIYFARGHTPRARMCRRGGLHRSMDLNLLPMPAQWRDLDYQDQTLLEEMVARLVLYLACALNPQRVHLFADFWSERLEGRIRYNCKKKLKQFAALPLVFHPSEEPALIRQSIGRNQ